MKQFEEILTKQVIPLASEMDMKLIGIWKAVTGRAGEYIEHWEFNSMTEFEKDWRNLLNNPKLQEIFKTTGPMVEDETFTLYEPVLKD